MKHFLTLLFLCIFLVCAGCAKVYLVDEKDAKQAIDDAEKSLQTAEDTKVDFNPNLIHYGSHILTASQGQGGRYDLNWKALKMISDGEAPVKKIVTARYPLDQAIDAVKHVGSKTGMKAIIYPYPEDIPHS